MRCTSALKAIAPQTELRNHGQNMFKGIGLDSFTGIWPFTVEKGYGSTGIPLSTGRK